MLEHVPTAKPAFTFAGHASGNGTVFELAKSGTSYTYTQLYSFSGASDGTNPYAALAFETDTAGTTHLYGTTKNGSANGGGGGGGRRANKVEMSAAERPPKGFRAETICASLRPVAARAR